MRKKLSPHRLIATMILGRALMPNEVVHHINGKNSDNRIFNLCVMDRRKHEHLHGWLDWHKKKNGIYPTFSEQKKALITEYGATLLDRVAPEFKSLDEFATAVSSNELPFDGEDTSEDRSLNGVDLEVHNDSRNSYSFGAKQCNDEIYQVRLNKKLKTIFLEFEEECLISPSGQIVEIDTDVFSNPTMVTSSELTQKQLEVYSKKLEAIDTFEEKQKFRSNLVNDLFQELKKKRLEIARANQIKAYLVFRDVTLMQIAEVMPETESLFLQIEGVGPDKMRMYGQQFLQVVKEFNKKAKKESA